MTGRSGPAPAGTWPFRQGLVLAAAAIAICAALLGSDLALPVRAAISGGALVLGGLTIAALCLHRSRRGNGRRRQSWVLLALAGMTAAAGNLWSVIRGVPASHSGAAAPADLLIVAALALALIGVLSFPAQRPGPELARMGLDGLVVGGSLLYVASVTVFPQILQPTGTSVFGVALAVVVPVIDVMVATVAGLLVWRGRDADRLTLLLVGSAFTAFAFSDFTAALITVSRPFTFGSPTDLGWIVGYTLLALAILRSRSSEDSDKARELSPVLGTVLMYAVFLASAVIGLPDLRANELSMPSVVVWLVVLAAVAARQLVLIVDNEALRRDLEQRVAERTTALREITEQTSLLVNSVGEGIYGVDAQGLVTFVNPAAARALRFAPGDLIGRDAHATFHTPSTREGPRQQICYITEAISQQVVTRAEEDVYLRSDGRPIPVEVTATPLRQNEVVQGAVVVFRDIAQRQEVDRMKHEFVSMVSHELRTPLTSIRGSLGLLAGGALGHLEPGASRLIALAADSTDRLTRLVNDILDIERIESGVLPMQPGVHPVAAMVQAAVAQVQVIAATNEVDIHVGPTPGWVRADSDRVVQVLLNLLSNAVKASPRRGRVEIAASVQGPMIDLSVSDSGRGVPVEQLDTIFSPFVQGDAYDGRDKGGFGLGLSISRSLAERMGGHLRAVNNPEGGATFHLTVPCGDLSTAQPAGRPSVQQTS